MIRSDSSEQAIHGDLSVSRKFHYSSNWKHDQDAVYWAKFLGAQKFGLHFWQTKSHALIVHKPVLLDGICWLLPRTERVHFSKDFLHHDPHRRSSFAIAGECSSSIRSSSQTPGSGNRLRIVLKQNLEIKQVPDGRIEITTSIFGEIDLRVDGIPQEAILKDEIQMENITESLQKNTRKFSNAGHL